MSRADEIVKVLLEADENEPEGIELIKDVTGNSPPKFDFLFELHGSICLAHPQNEQAREWLLNTMPEGAQTFGDALVIEPRYVNEVVRAMMDDGWVTNVEFRRHESLGEAEDDEQLIKDILGIGYQREPPEKPDLTGDVERFDRWADISIGHKNYCISYLTPVAVYIPGEGVKLTDKDWSSTTKRHIVKWVNYIGIGPEGGYRAYSEFMAINRNFPERFARIPQQELIDMFKNDAQRVAWTKRQAKRAVTFRPPRMGLKGGAEHRVSIDPYEKPR